VTVYRLEYDIYKFPRVVISPDEIEDKIPSGRKGMKPNISKVSYWSELNGDIDYGDDIPHSTPCPDLSNWLSSIIISEEAKNMLEGELEKFGELLPVNINNQKMYYFNTLNVNDDIDPFNTKREIIDGIDMGITKLAFLEHKVENLGIFRSNYDGSSYLYCTGSFKELLENSGLSSGWSFNKELRDK